MLIQTVVLLSLQHKMEQKYASAKNRISFKFITLTKYEYTRHHRSLTT